MKVLLVFSLFLVSVGGGESRTVRGYPGGGVLIRCRYERRYTSNPKYFCKSGSPNYDDQIRTGVKNEWNNTKKFSLLDNTSSAEFWVMIRDLTVQDSGSYQCAVDIRLAPDVYTPVELTVEEDLSYKKSISVIGHVGGSVNITCKYPQSLSRDPKFLCRRVGTECKYKTPVEESRKWTKQGNLDLYDHRAIQTLTVSINSLTEGDSGEYWCGAESHWTSNNGYKVYITQVHLRVTAAGSAGTTPHSPSSLTARPTLQSTSTPISSTSKPTETSTPQTKASEGSTVIVVVSVILAVLLIGLLLLIVTLQKKRKTQGAAPTQSLPLKDSSKAPTSTYDYDKIKGRSGAGDSIVYTTVDHRPTDLSEPSQNLYGNVQLPSGPSERSNPVYCSVSAKPDEGPTYATVSFDKNTGSSTDGASTGTFTKDDTSCEYAVVRHAT